MFRSDVYSFSIHFYLFVSRVTQTCFKTLDHTVSFSIKYILHQLPLPSPASVLGIHRQGILPSRGPEFQSGIYLCAILSQKRETTPSIIEQHSWKQLKVWKPFCATMKSTPADTTTVTQHVRTNQHIIYRKRLDVVQSQRWFNKRHLRCWSYIISPVSYWMYCIDDNNRLHEHSVQLSQPCCHKPMRKSILWSRIYTDPLPAVWSCFMQRRDHWFW